MFVCRERKKERWNTFNRNQNDKLKQRNAIVNKQFVPYSYNCLYGLDLTTLSWC